MLLKRYAGKIASLLLAALLLCLAAPPETEAAIALKANDRGSQVITLQKKLQQLNYAITSVDGVFGPETKAAVLQFQRDKKIKRTGVVDAKTWAALQKAKPLKSTQKTPQIVALPVNVKETAPFVRQSEAPKILKTAKGYIGVPYKFGGVTPKGFDCSGYVQYVFSAHKATLPRSADDQFKLGKKVNKNALREGDLVFFSTYEKGASHCGIYVGNSKFIHVSTSKGVRIDELSDAYWKPKYLGAKRVTK